MIIRSMHDILTADKALYDTIRQAARVAIVCNDYCDYNYFVKKRTYNTTCCLTNTDIEALSVLLYTKLNNKG